MKKSSVSPESKNPSQSRTKRAFALTTRYLTTAALFVALDIVFTRFLRVEVYPYERISLQFLSHSMAGILFGPIGAGATAVAGDLMGMLVNSGGLNINPALTGVAALRGLIYGLLLYKGKKSYPQILAAVAAVTIVCDLTLNSFIFQTFFNLPAKTIFLTKLPFRLPAIPLFALLLWVLWKRIEKSGLAKHFERRPKKREAFSDTTKA